MSMTEPAARTESTAAMTDLLDRLRVLTDAARRRTLAPASPKPAAG